MRNADRRDEFVTTLATYIVGNQAEKSILLQMQKREALEWAALRNTLPMMGWATIEEAELKIRDFLWPKDQQ